MPLPNLTTGTLFVDAWKENFSSGKVFAAEAEFDDGSNFYDGIHQSISHNSMEVVSFKENLLRVKWTFETGTDGSSGVADFESPFECVTVWLLGKFDAGSENIAKELFAKHFDPDDFAKPVFSEQTKCFVFKRKQ